MKSIIKYISAVIIGSLGLVSCETHDLVDEIARTGHFAPNVYMEVPLTNVSAGGSVEFNTEYWSEDDEYTDLSLWYSLHVSLKYELTSVYNSDYSFVLDSSELVREYHEVNTYEHSDANYDEEKKAYSVNDEFPVSYTLSSSEISDPDTYNETQISRLFPESVIEGFYEGLFQSIGYETLKEILVADFEIIEEDAFDSHFDVIEEEPAEPDGDPVIVYEMKEDSRPVLLGHLKEVPLYGLTYNEAIPAYGINFFRGYELKTKFRVVNGYGTENFSEEKTITVN